MKWILPLAALLFLQDDDLAKRTQQLQKEVTASRGLAFKDPVKVGRYTRAQLSDFLKNDEDAMTAKEAIALQKVFSHFGVIPDGLNLHQALLDLLGDSISGFYHPRTKELRLIRGEEKSELGEYEREHGLQVPIGDVTFVHELCHAAQDQNHDLLTLPLDEEHDDDLALAVRSLVEGDASVVGFKYGFRDNFEEQAKYYIEQYKSGAAAGKAATLPLFLRRNLTFPYGYGTEFVIRLLDRHKGDWKKINDAFGSLPASTEQIMHPQKYYGAQRDHPQAVALSADKLIPSAREVANNVYGEFGVLLLLDEYKRGSAIDRRAAAEGWDGDRYYLYESPEGALSSAWFSTWDTEEDAEEFFKAYGAALGAKYKHAERESGAQRATFDLGRGRKTILERRGLDVLAADNLPNAAVNGLNAVWTSATKSEVTSVARVDPAKKKPKK